MTIFHMLNPDIWATLGTSLLWALVKCEDFLAKQRIRAFDENGGFWIDCECTFRPRFLVIVVEKEGYERFTAAPVHFQPCPLSFPRTVGNVAQQMFRCVELDPTRFLRLWP